jgi:tetratricopeptide (TPR) repeat protein
MDKNKKDVLKQPAARPIFSRVVFYIIIVVLGIILYSNSVNGMLLLDDDVYVKNNIFVKSWTHLSDIFTKTLGKGSGSDFSYYRPLQILLYTAIYGAWGLNVQPYHILSIILHILAALCVYWMARTLCRDDTAASLASLLYLVHPMNVESVAYVSGMGDCLVAIFMLSSFALYIKETEKGSIIGKAALFLAYIAALFSKEHALVLPAVFLCYHYAFKIRIKLPLFLTSVLLAGAYLVFRVQVVGGDIATGTGIKEIIARVPGFFVAMTGYTRILIAPFNLYMGYDSRFFSMTEPRAFLGLCIVAALIFAAINAARKSNALTFFCIGWFFIMLAPVSNLYSVAFYMADHYLSLPSIGIFLIVSKKFSSLYAGRSSRYYALIAAAVILVLYSILTVKQNDYWKDPFSFFRRTLSYNPQSFRTLNNLGRQYELKGEMEKARVLYQQAIDANPVSHKEAYNNLGNMCSRLGKDEESVELYKKALGIDSHYAKAHYNLGIAYEKLGRFDEAAAAYKEAIRCAPTLAEPYEKLGAVYERLGNEDEAVRSYKKSIESNAALPAPYNSLGMFYAKRGRYEDAVTWFKKAIEIDPGNANIYNNLGIISAMLGKNDESVEFYKKALKIDPNYPQAHNNLATLYSQEGLYEPAIEHYDKAVELGYAVDPQLGETLKGYRK